MKETLLKIGYRVDYPYLDCKIWVEHDRDISELKKQVESAIGEYCISANNREASQECHDLIANKKRDIFIEDQATYGFLQSKLTSHDTWHYLHFIQDKQPDSFPYLHISGLSNFWEHDPANKNEHSPKETELVLTWQASKSAEPITVKKNDCD